MRKTYQVLTLLLILALVAVIAGQAIASDLSKEATLYYRNIHITLDGEEVLPTDVNGNYVEPFIIDGTTYLPVRGVASALGLDVDWDGDTSTVILSTEAAPAEQPAPQAEAPAQEPAPQEPATQEPAPQEPSAPVQTGENEATWALWRWYLDGGSVYRAPLAGGAAEGVYALPEDDAASLLSARLFVQEDSVYLQYYSGGATMGSNKLIRFAEDGSYADLTRGYSSLEMQGDVMVQVGKPTPPYPNNLTVSYDGGQTWQALGDETYCYGCVVSEDAYGMSAVSNDDLTIQDGYVYVLGVWDLYHQLSSEPLTTVVCRVDLTTGETTELTGPATGFAIQGSTLTYTTPEGQSETVSLGA